MDALPDLGPLPGPPLPPVTLETAGGAHVLGAPTVDSNADGAPDTVVLAATGPGGDALVLATDLDGDHHADVVSTVDAAGRAVTTTAGAHARFAVDPVAPADTGPGPWPDTGPDAGHDGRDGAWSGSPAPPPAPAPTIDPVSGTWTRGPGGS